MADKTKDEPRSQKDSDGLTLQVANGVATYSGALAGIRGPDHATTQGYYDGFDDEKGMIPSSGFFGDASKTGDTSADEPPTQNAHVGPKLVDLAVTGVTGRGDIGKPIYATDNNTFTLTRPTLGEPVAWVADHIASTTVKALFPGLAAHCQARSQAELIYLGELDFSTVADGDLRTGFPMPFHGEILAFFGMVKEVGVGAGGTIDVSLEIEATDVTGGVLTYSTAAANTLGEKLDATAITADNVFHEGDSLDVEGSSAGGTRTSGKLELYVKVLRRPGN